MPGCGFVDCGRPGWANGLCAVHNRQRWLGRPLRPIHHKRAIVPHPSDPSLALVPLTRGYWATIDAADAIAVGTRNWAAHGSGRKFYAFGGRELLHRFIATLAGLSLDRDIDHRNGNGLDCRRQNLRPATHAQNMQNARRPSHNTSGIKGVQWHVGTSRWRATIHANGRTHHVGLFASIDDAAAAVRVAREQLHGEFANHGTN